MDVIVKEPVHLLRGKGTSQGSVQVQFEVQNNLCFDNVGHIVKFFKLQKKKKPTTKYIFLSQSNDLSSL